MRAPSYTRHTTSFVAAALTLIALGACNPFANKHQVGEIDPKNAGSSARWNATLSTPGGMSGAIDVRGTASLAGSGTNRSIASVRITNAAPDGVHPWEVYRGNCGSDGELLGSASAYPLLTVDKDGIASASATLPYAVPVDGSYHVNVNASAANMDNVIACGNLAQPSGE